MRVACFTFGIVAGLLAGVFALVAVGQVLYFGFGADPADRFVRERAFYQWTSLTSGFATLGGLCFVAAAIFRHAEASRRPRAEPGTAPDRG